MSRASRPPRLAVVQCTLQGLGGYEKYGVHALEALATLGPVDVITAHEVNVPAVERAFNARLDGARFRRDPRSCPHPQDNLTRWRSFWERRRLWQGYQQITHPYDLVIGQTTTLPWASAAKRGILLNHCPVVRTLRLAADVPAGWRALLDPAAREQRDIRRRLASWTRIVANSDYTRRWVRDLWGRDAVVINPPIAVNCAPDLAEKKPWIVAVGFFAPPSDDQWSLKRHEVLIERFKRMCREGLSGWEFHLAGHMVDTPPARAHLDALRRCAVGYPVHFQLNRPHSELAAGLYRYGSIYWHATGYGVDEGHDLGRVESFGMSTAEAMAAGVVPVVIDRGGQPEIVRHGESGYLWSTLEDLERLTLELIRNPEQRWQIANAGSAYARRYGLERFRQEFLEVVHEELATLGVTR